MQRGQASLEYVAVVAVVAVVLAVGAAVAGADAIPRAVAADVHRAFCLVAGGDCMDGAPRPCTTGTRSQAQEKRLKAILARLADGRTVLTEERSDGTVAVTVTDTVEALGGPRITKAVTGKLGARLSAGRRWVVADAAAARRLVDGLDRLSVGEAGRGAVRFLVGGSGDERFLRFGTRGEASGALNALGLRGEALAGLTAGARVSADRRTLELAGDGGISGAFAAPFGAVAGTGVREVAVELTFDRDRRPVELLVRGHADVRGTVRVGQARATGGDRLEAEARLDLTEPRARALADAFLDRPTPARAAALGRHLAGAARIDVRLYATTHAERSGGPTKLGVGYETFTATDTATLVEAYGREPGLGWSRRLDCLGPA